jgi:hypothetical protein
MQCARKTPEAVLCHFNLVLELACKQQRPLWASASTLWQVAGVHYLKLQIGDPGENTIAVFALHKCGDSGHLPIT